MQPQPLSSNHFLHLLRPALQRNRAAPVFRGPHLGSTSGLGRVTYGDFDHHLAAAETHWRRTLGGHGLRARDVVGVWITGHKYEDLVNILSLSAAGYVPQLFGSVFSSPNVMWDLLARSRARCLLFDEAFASSAASSPVPTFPALTFSDLQSVITDADYDRRSIPAVTPEDTALFFHSSGTTSGTPKIIPTSHSWIAIFLKEKYAVALEQGSFAEQTVINNLGSISQAGTFCTFLGVVYRGSCMAQPSSLGSSTEDVLEMITESGLNRLLLYAPFVSRHIHSAQKDPKVLAALQSLRQIIFTGVALDPEDAAWAFEHRLPLTGTYATSETAPLLISVLGNSPADRLFRPIPGTTAQLVPSVSADTAGVPDTSRSVLFEVVVPRGAPDSPHSSFISDDGLYHTGDLFAEVEKGLYQFRGRTGDWIKTHSGLVDTKSIEDHVRKICSDLVDDVVVCGAQRPGPSLFVESVETGLDRETRGRVAMEIVGRMAPFNERLFPHERIDDPGRVLVLEKGAIPRTKEKMNVRRNATEQMFKKELDAIYAV